MDTLGLLLYELRLIFREGTEWEPGPGLSVSSHPKDGVKEVWAFEVLQNSLKDQQTSVQHDLIRLEASSLLSEGTFLKAYSETSVTGAVFSDGGQINRRMSCSILSPWKPTSSSSHKWFGSNFTVTGQMIKIPSSSLLPQRNGPYYCMLVLLAWKPNWTHLMPSSS